MIFIVLAVFIGWKIIKRTRFLRGAEVDLQSDLAEIEEYTEDVSITIWTLEYFSLTCLSLQYNAREAAKPPRSRARRCFDAIW